MSPAWRIALRYLFSKKSHGAVSAIATVSVAGVAIATAAAVCVLSVFNGFKEVLAESYNTLAPDLTVSPVSGKLIDRADSLASRLGETPGVAAAMPAVADKALAVFQGREYPVSILGVESEAFSRISGVDSVILDGGRMPADRYEEMPEFEYFEDYEEYINSTPKPEALPSIGAAVRLGNMQIDDDMMIFAPVRHGRYNPANPAASFVMDSVRVTGVYRSGRKEYDEDMVIVPIGLARHLFQLDDEASRIELRVNPDADLQDVKNAVASRLGKNFLVRDRAEQQQLNFRMINIEKWVSFLLLTFILIIATFNIVSTMTMLVLEKRHSMRILESLGMARRNVAGIFARESIIVSLLGGLLGVALGVALCLLQQHYGFVKLDGNPETLLIRYYPVKVVWTDVALAFLPSPMLGLLTALVIGAFARRRL